MDDDRYKNNIDLDADIQVQYSTVDVVDASVATVLKVACLLYTYRTVKGCCCHVGSFISYHRGVRIDICSSSVPVVFQYSVPVQIQAVEQERNGNASVVLVQHSTYCTVSSNARRSQRRLPDNGRTAVSDPD